MAWLLVKKFNELINEITSEFDTLKGQVVNENIIVFEKFSNNFINDKALIVDKKNIQLIDGVILNKRDLIKARDSNEIIEWIANKENNEEPICNKLRGPFTGCIYDLNNDELYSFGNQTGDTSVFYYIDDTYFAVSSDFNLVFNYCIKNNKELTFNEIAANHILSLGYVVEGNTFVKEIKKTCPGELVRLAGNKLTIETYHKFDNNHNLNISLEESIELVDEAFRKAVKRCFDKDLEYGYSHLADMSAGLDSRMTSWVAKDLGYKDITNICYAKAKSKEEKYSYEAANILGNEFIFKPLDDLKFIYDIEKIIPLNYGLAIYCGITGGKRMLEDINFSKFGLEHTGQLGDGIVSSYCNDPLHNVIDIQDLSYSELITPILKGIKNYENHELFALYYRAFQGMFTTHYIRRNFTEAVSPFMDVEFIQLCLSIPLKYRCNHYLYFEWIYKKYPNAAKLLSTTVDPRYAKLTWRDITRKLVGKNKRIIIKSLKKLGLNRFIQDPNTMNPMDYWYNTNEDIKIFMDSYYASNINKLDKYPETKSIIEKMYTAERFSDKAQALTVLGVYNVYFEKNNRSIK